MAKPSAEERALLLAKFGANRSPDLDPQKQAGRQTTQPKQPAQPKQAQAKQGGRLADGRKDLERAIWGDQPAPGADKGGLAAENIADTIDRALGGGEVAQTIDNILQKFGRKSEPNRDKAKTKSKDLEPGQ